MGWSNITVIRIARRCFVRTKALPAVSRDISPTRRNDTPEVYDPGADTWEQLNKAKLSPPLYPWMFVLP